MEVDKKHLVHRLNCLGIRSSIFLLQQDVESMDYILQGILASSHQDDVKLQLIGKICDNGSCNPRDSDVCCVLTLAMDWVLNGTSALQVILCCSSNLWLVGISLYMSYAVINFFVFMREGRAIKGKFRLSSHC